MPARTARPPGPAGSLSQDKVLTAAFELARGRPKRRQCARAGGPARPQPDPVYKYFHTHDDS